MDAAEYITFAIRSHFSVYIFIIKLFLDCSAVEAISSIMDARNLIELLEMTTNLDPVNITQAEERLSQVKKTSKRMLPCALGFKSDLTALQWNGTDCGTIVYNVNAVNGQNFSDNHCDYNVQGGKTSVLHERKKIFFCSRHTILI